MCAHTDRDGSTTLIQNPGALGRRVDDSDAWAHGHPSCWAYGLRTLRTLDTFKPELFGNPADWAGMLAWTLTALEICKKLATANCAKVMAWAHLEV